MPEQRHHRRYQGELHYRRLLVAVDGSANAKLALSGAVTVARHDDEAITLISVETGPVLAATWVAVAVLRAAGSSGNGSIHARPSSGTRSSSVT